MIRRAIAIGAAAAAAIGLAAAQDDVLQQHLRMDKEKMAAQVKMLSVQGAVMGKTVKSAPYSGVEISEHMPKTAEQMKQTSIYQSYAQVAPRPQDWPVLCSKLGNMFRQDYDWSADVVKIKLPVLLAYGDADAVRTASAVQFFELLGGGQRDGGWDASGMSSARLSILPGTTHYSIFSSPQLSSVVTRFLDTPIQPAH